MASPNPDRHNDREIHAPITKASPEVQQIIQKVLEIEKERLDKNDRGHINEEILKIIKEAVQ
jgi:hypothetical protein